MNAAADDHVTEFDCIECGRHIIHLCGPKPMKLCAACMTIPGWYRDPRLREVLDPDHDGRDRADQERPNG